VNEIDIGNAQCDLAGEDDALVQYVIEHVEQRDVGLSEFRPRRRTGRRGGSPASVSSHSVAQDSMKL